MIVSPLQLTVWLCFGNWFLASVTFGAENAEPTSASTATSAAPMMSLLNFPSLVDH